MRLGALSLVCSFVQSHGGNQQQLRTDTGEAASRTYDYAVVGAGSAGSVAAAFLARWAPAGSTVALFESGSDHPEVARISRHRHPSDWTEEPGVHIPGEVWHRFRLRCNGTHEASCTNCQAESCLMQGRLLGGSSAVNGQLFMWPAAEDIPHWTAEDVEYAQQALEMEMPRVLLSATWQELGHHLHKFIRALEETLPSLRWRLDPHEQGSPTARISGMLRSQSPWTGPDGEQMRRVASAVD